MKLYCYLQLKPIKQVKFVSPIGEQIKAIDPSIIQFEADNQSDLYHLKRGVEFIEESSIVLLHLDALPNEKIGPLSKLLETIRRHKKSVCVIWEGEHEMLTKTISMLNPKKEYQLNEVDWDEVKDTFTTSF
ncbi:hypothetical protein [Roseivirga pacifica]|uniref:hypothetical protein n=1 Tax=Roseivirga pacifica TaxID=1267423 RepID=UPI0020959F2F|nr:hypothetical protein [Roseivirga pacifica]MCO6358327.1 hypothetical protein [Roseivirga pacifica]MCO6366209.1 hypothetical protein [Roseivirga pacifica]MCO6369240.1 hypothetical protein [Roseivirga pacifica]MCO6374058.1 hypothetical protein [Roseivirga pacifica]MCO6378434.1 hypothetical protein [Roseivirga pacifica]